MLTHIYRNLFSACASLYDPSNQSNQTLTTSEARPHEKENSKDPPPPTLPSRPRLRREITHPPLPINAQPQTPPSTLLTLPPELRLQIWSHTLSSHHPLRLRLNHTPTPQKLTLDRSHDSSPQYHNPHPLQPPPRLPTDIQREHRSTIQQQHIHRALAVHAHVPARSRSPAAAVRAHTEVGDRV